MDTQKTGKTTWLAKLRLKLNRDLASKGEAMALCTIGEVASLCDINPVTLRVQQRRYGLLKPQRTDGGHRLLNDAGIDRVCEIKHRTDNGVQVSKVEILLSNENVDMQNGWRDQQGTLPIYLRSGNLHSLRTWIRERGQGYPAQTLATHPSTLLCRRLQCQQLTLQALSAILDGVLINYIATCLALVRKEQGKDVLVVGWDIQDITRLWLEGWIASQQGWRIDVLAHSFNQLRPELFEDRTLLAWCGESRTSAQQQQFTNW